MSQGRIQLTRTTTRQFLDFLDQLKSKTMRRRVVYLSVRGDERLRQMERTTGVDLSQMVNDMIKEYYDEGFKTRN